MAKTFTLILIGTLAFLSWLEVLRYRQAAGGAEELPYPRSRLTRRLTISGLLIAILLAMGWQPPFGPWGRLLYLSAILTGVVLALGLVWRDLRETSLAAVREAERLKRAEADDIQRLVDEAREERRRRDEE